MNNTDFITEWKVTAGFTICVSIHVRQTNMVSSSDTATADWGDGCVEQVKFHHDGIRHTYKEAGTYTVSFSDNIEEFSVGLYGSRGTREHLIDVKQWGAAKWRTLSYMFYSAKNMTMSATDTPDLGRWVSTKKMFAYCDKFNSPINHWDVANITNAWGMLYEAPAFNQDMSNWVELSNKGSANGLANAPAETMHIFHYPIEEYQEKYNANTEKDLLLEVLG